MPLQQHLGWKSQEVEDACLCFSAENTGRLVGWTTEEEILTNRASKFLFLLERRSGWSGQREAVKLIDIDLSRMSSAFSFSCGTLSQSEPQECDIPKTTYY
jgi:hypothetical protein